VRSAVSNETIARMLRDFVVTRILRRIGKELGFDPAEGAMRANLVASQIGGLIMVRYILKFEPLASAPPETVVALIAPTVQRYLTGSLDPPATEPEPGRRTVALGGPATTLLPSGPESERSGRRGRD
jgi:hypothetical protein